MFALRRIGLGLLAVAMTATAIIVVSQVRAHAGERAASHTVGRTGAAIAQEYAQPVASLWAPVTDRVLAAHLRAEAAAQDRDQTAAPAWAPVTEQVLTAHLRAEEGSDGAAQ